MKATAFKFGPFELDSMRVELRRRGIRLRISPSHFRLLLLFVTRPGELVTREQIAACLWKEGQNVDVMGGINTAVNKLRSHLGDTAATPNYIETVTGTGYRFVARVVEIDEPEEPLQAPAPASSDAALSSPPLPAPVLPARQGFKFRVAIAAVVVVPASILLYWLFASALAPKAPRAELELVYATSSGDIRSADISPDGKLIAYVRDTAGRQTLWVKQLATDRVLQFDDLDGDHCPGLAFSPDGSYVYFVRKPELNPNGVLYRVPYLGGTPVRVLSGISGEPAISPDGRRVAFIRSTLATHGEDSVVTAGVDGSGERTLASYGAPGIHFNRIIWTPDGKYLVFPFQSHLMLIPAEGGAAQQIPGDPWISIDDLGALPPGRSLVVVGLRKGSLRPQIFAVSLPSGEIQQVTHDLSQYVAVRASADGKALLAVQNQILSSIQVLATGSKSEVLTLSAENQAQNGVDGLAWTPTGNIIYGSLSDSHREFREMESDGTNQRMLLSGSAPLGFFQLVVSPRNDFIVATRWFENDVANIWRLDLNGQNASQLTNGKQDFPLSITPDGKWIVYGSLQGDRSVLMKVSSQGGSPVQLTDYQADSPSVSPDGLWIACLTVSSRNKSPSLAVIPISGGEPTRLIELPATASPPFDWSPDSRQVAFINSPDGVGNLYAQPLADGPAVPLTHFTSGRIFNFQWSRHGLIVLSRGSDTVDAVLIRNFRH